MKTSWEWVALLVVAFALPGCVPGNLGESGTKDSQQAEEDSQDDDDEMELTPEEKTYLATARPFAEAIAARRYDAAHKLLSSHAQARMSLNQFDPAEDDAVFERNENQPVQNVAAPRFAELMKNVEARYGAPKSVESLYVFETDPAVLGRQSKEDFGAVDSMFAIGAMPDSIPLNIRRASIRGEIRTEPSPEELAKTAAELDMTIDELKQNEDFAPYLNLKIVLVEEGGSLRVGYFEFLPPSILD